MKLVEAKQLREDAVRARLKEMFPDATEAQLDEAVPQAIAKGLGAGAQVLKKAGVAAAKGAKKVGQAVAKGAKQAGAAVQKGAKAVGKEVGAGYKAVKGVAKKGIDTANKGLDAVAQDIDKATQQKAAMGSRLAGGKNAAQFARGASMLTKGKGITAQMAQELGPHVGNLQLVLADPMLRNQFMMLVKKAKKGQA